MSDQFAIVYTTLPDEAEAERLARSLVDQHLAGCVHMQRVRSIYRWNDSIESAEEIRLSCKVARSALEAVFAHIKAGHSYELPEIIALDIVAGDPAYLAWLTRVSHKAD